MTIPPRYFRDRLLAFHEQATCCLPVWLAPYFNPFSYPAFHDLFFNLTRKPQRAHVRFLFYFAIVVLSIPPLYFVHRVGQVYSCRNHNAWFVHTPAVRVHGTGSDVLGSAAVVGKLPRVVWLYNTATMGSDAMLEETEQIWRKLNPGVEVKVVGHR